MTYAVALLATFVVEVPIVVAALVRAGAGVGRAVLAAFVANATSHPTAFLALAALWPALSDTVAGFAALELAIVLWEAWVFARVGRIDGWSSVSTSAIANVASLLAGLVISAFVGG